MAAEVDSALPGLQPRGGKVGHIAVTWPFSQTAMSPNCCSTASLCVGRKKTQSPGCRAWRPDPNSSCWFDDGPIKALGLSPMGDTGFANQ